MPAVKVLARGWFLEAQDPDSLAWVEVKGINSLTFDGSKNDADTTTFDNEGWNTHLVASRGRTIGLEGFYLEDPVTKGRDPGQELVDSINDQIGYESLGNFRLTSPSGTVRTFVASANVSGIGGGNDDPTGWGVELTVSGEAAFAEVLPTSIDSLPETVSLAAGETQLITTTFTPGNTTNKQLTYASANTAVAAVTPEGRIVGIATGGPINVTVTSVASGAITDTIAVTVT